MSDAEQDDATSLERIASVLKVPIERFFGPEIPTDPYDPRLSSSDEAEQALELMRLFLRLQDPVVRVLCITYVRKQVERDQGPAPDGAP